MRIMGVQDEPPFKGRDGFRCQTFDLATPFHTFTGAEFVVLAAMPIIRFREVHSCLRMA
jgi:hypothetical protein